ncbi:MAG: hypothetical protein JO257_18605, partial [Deltaproteobacteria bacterium]|nr:hypothetical protein [Deltaproteobacteria bacterium]
MLASIVGCNGNCSQNAVFVAEQAKRLGPTIDTIEAYSDLNGDGELTDGTNMSFVDERGFVIDPRAGVRKALRIRFMLPESRQLLLLPPPCLVDPLDPNSTCPPSFLTFSSLFDPCPNPDSPDCHPWVSDVYFNDDPTDHETAGTTQDVTYVLYDDLVTPFLSTTPMPVKVDIGLDQLDPTNEPAEFVFVLARQTLSPVPPRIVSMSPSPFPPLPGWGRPINAQDFAGRQLADVLALVDQNEMGTGANLFQRVAPHNGIDMRFDAPIENVVVSIALRPSVPEITPPFGIELGASTIAFLTPFQEATSDTAVGMAPDQVYTVKVLSSSDVAFAPVLRGTESDIGRFLMPDFDDDRYQFLRGAGYTDYQLANSVKFTFRTGPFRITQPVHHGGTNATTAPNGMFTAQLQFARPSDPLPSPTTVTITISPHGLATTTSSLGFPSGSADTIQQDGFVRSNGVTTHAVPIQLPAEPFDDVVDIDMAVFSGPTLADLVGHDKIQIHHDNIVPTIDNNVSVTNTYTDGALDQVCLTSDCDVASFDVSTAESPRCRIPFNQCAAGSVCVAGTCASVISRSQATSVSTCSNGRAQYCFSDVSLGLASNVVEGPLDVTFRAIDDQGNVSDPVTVHTEPTCRDFGKFVAADGRRSAIVTADDGTPLVAWTSDTALRYAEPEAPPSANTGRWSRHAQTVAQLGAGETFGLGIDLALDPVTRRPVVCFVQGAAAATDVDAVGTLHVLEQDPTGAWAELSARPGVQPLGCSLSSLGNSILVGWIEQQRPRWGFGDSLTIDHAPLPLPNAAFPGAQLQYWDLDVVGFNDRIWFTYRSQNAQLADTPGAPGSIFIGSTDSGGQAPVVQVVCPPFRKCPGIGQSYGTGNPLTEGWAPRIVVDDQGVGVAYVSVEDDGNFSFEHHRALEVLAGGVPVGNQPVTFTAYHHEEAAPALGGYTGDGVSPAGIIETPFSRPALVRDVDGPILLASWARNTTQSLPGNEDVAVLHYNPLDDSSFVVVVDRRVSNDDAAHSEAVPVHVSRGPHGYQLVYRNPATGMLEFAAEQETLPQSGPAGRFACGRAWSSSVLSEDELNLKYAIPNQLWAPSCAGTSPSLSLTRPFVFGGETLARPNSTVIDDIVTTSTASVDKHMVLRNGRVPLKEQLRVCRPLNANGEIDDQVCDPLKTLNGTVTPPPTNTCGAQGAHCIQGEDCCSGVCRIGGRCAGSPGSSTTCPAVSPGDTTRGDMDWILSPDAQTCSRCTPGSTPHPCL